MSLILANYALLAAPSDSLSWGIVLFFIIVGLLVTLSPAKRTYEVKKPREE